MKFVVERTEGKIYPDEYTHREIHPDRVMGELTKANNFVDVHFIDINIAEELIEFVNKAGKNTTGRCFEGVLVNFDWVRGLPERQWILEIYDGYRE